MAPAPIPNTKAKINPRIHIRVCAVGSIPEAAVHITAETAAPVTILPSTVKSGVLSVRNDKNTPKASIEYISPSSNASSNVTINIL